MKILAIETSCDETSAAVVEDGRKILSNVTASQISTHSRFGGVVPEIASRMHAECISEVTEQALADADLSIDGIDAIAVTYAPGLIGALLVGVSFAKGLAFSAGLPLVAVHHLSGHIAANYLSESSLTPPFLALVISGGHTNIIEVKDYTDFNLLGKSRDDAAGETFDKAARVLGFPYPGGIEIDKLAGQGNPTAFKFPHPRPQTEEKPYDFSFSGLKTAVVNTIHNAEQKGVELNKADICASFQQTVCEMLCENVSCALGDTGLKKLVLAGGVSANSGIRTALTEMCENQGVKIFIPPVSLCGDNAAMIGAQAYYDFLAGKKAPETLNAYATKQMR
ncbi:MAG: tRNA (adenosine(37)-N6)-threonylcarbamoyltransferase complex transferase subunit TsaD [Ruminococcus sp.]|jgi:N6-L-threonylcarbamoyladenine synthase|nr:tRNA (adenosine(37)-N6)-threonylcarbamoyltransferase complex transferase subunit TsaD [Ruminococcus sp.]